MQNVMLTTKKVKLHGMKSRRWTTSDKIAQYRGLVKLYNRDKKILESDTIVSRKKLKKEIKNLTHEIDGQRNELNNAIMGDRQRLRNTLSEHRTMQLAYTRLHPLKVVDALYQDNFNKRKELDRMKYSVGQRTQKLIELKLLYAELEDRIKYEATSQIPEEEMAQIVTAQVQDAILKMEAARDVRDTYYNILNILKKDAMYMDAVLAALQIDGYYQGKCIIKITEMGQLATEYLDDRKEECKMLEKVIKKNMADREKSLRVVKDRISDLHNNVKYLIRKDSIIDLDQENEKKHPTPSVTRLMEEIDDLEKQLEILRSTAVVLKLKDIFPRMQEQKRQNERLKALVEKSIENRDILVTKSKHAEEMHNSLSHTMVETTFWYKEEKVRLNEETEELIAARKENEELIHNKGGLLITVRSALQTLVELMRNVETEKEPTGAKRGQKVKQVAIEEKVTKHTPVEVDAMKLIGILNEKFAVLNANANITLDDDDMATAVGVYLNFVQEMTVKAPLEAGLHQEESLVEVTLDDPTVPTRFDIKGRSARICEENAKSEFDAPDLTGKKK